MLVLATNPFDTDYNGQVIMALNTGLYEFKFD